MDTQIDTNTHLSKSWLIVARLTWIVIVSLTMILFAAGLVNGLGQLRVVCMTDVCHPNQLSPAQAELNRQIGVSLNFYGWYTTIVFAVFGSVFFAIAWVIFWLRSDEWMALFVSMWMVMIGAGVNAVIPRLGGVVFGLGIAGIFPLFSLFPDGRFVPRWIRWLVLGWILFSIVNRIVSPSPSRGISSGTPNPIFLAALLIGIGAQIYRYVRVSTPLQRQQTKWALFGFAGWFISVVLLLLSLAFFPALRNPGVPEFFLNRYAFAFVGLFPLLFIPMGIGISILRYRLWDIDLIIHRTLVYGLLSTSLALIYFLSVVLLQRTLQTAIGHESPLAVVGSTLFVAALFSPLRRRIQNVIDRLFFRRKYKAEKILAILSTRLREDVEINQISWHVMSVVDQALQPESQSLWLKKPGGRLQSGEVHSSSLRGDQIV